MQLRGHQNAVLEVSWYADERNLVSCGADKNVFLWDHETGQRIKKFAGHASCVNSCHTPNLSPHTRFPFLVTGSDDSTIKLWDNRVKGCIETIKNMYPVTSVSFSDSSSSTSSNSNKSSSETGTDSTQVNQGSGIVNPGQWIITSGVDEVIKIWDWRKLRSGSGNGNDEGFSTLFQLEGHNDTITGIRISRDGAYLLSTGMDNNTFIWDIRPFVPGGKRLIKQFNGVQHSYEKILLKCAWSSDDSKVSSGSSDRFVNIWDTSSRKLLYKLPGHKGSVNDVDFHPSEPIIASCSSDQAIYLGEIKP